MRRHGPISRHFFLTLVVVMASALLLAGCATTSGGSKSKQRSGKPTPAQEAASYNVQLGARYMQQGRVELAKQKLERALEQDPNSANAHTSIAVLFESIGKMEQAEYHYRRAVRLDPENAGALNNFGTFLCKTEQLREAEDMFARALDQPFYGTPEVALSNAGKCVMRIPDLTAAEQYFRQALDANEAFPDALYNLARIHLARDDYLRARAFLQRFETVAAHQPESLALGIRIENALGDRAAASRYRNQLTAAFPNSEEARLLGEES